VGGCREEGVTERRKEKGGKIMKGERGGAGANGIKTNEWSLKEGGAAKGKGIKENLS